MIDLQKVDLLVPVQKIQRLEEILGNAEKKIKRELYIALNNTAKRVESVMAKEISKELTLKQKTIKSVIVRPKKASLTHLSTTVRIKEKGRISLREYGARQTKTGVGYRTSKRTGRKRIEGAFQGPKPGVINVKWRGHVFIRVGPERTPIIKLYGPSPWGAFKHRGMMVPTEAQARYHLRNEVNRRIRFQLLKSEKKLNWQQPKD